MMFRLMFCMILIIVPHTPLCMDVLYKQTHLRLRTEYCLEVHVQNTLIFLLYVEYCYVF